jgi:hypothetical protein
MSIDTAFATTFGSYMSPPISEETTYYVTSVGQKYESTPRVSISFDIVATPLAEFTSLSTVSTQFSCGSSAMLTASDQGDGVVYQWYRNNELVGESEVPMLEVDAEGSYRLSVNRGGCSASTASIRVVLNHVPEADILTSNLRFCDVGILRAASVEGGVYEWFKDDVSFATSVEPTLEISESGNYSVKVTQYGCENTSASRFAEVLELPAVVDLSVSNATLCPGESVTLTATEVEGATYRWTRNGRPVGYSEGNNVLVRQGGGEYAVSISYPGFSCSRESEIAEVIVLDMPIARVLKDGSELVLTPERPEPISSIDWYYEFEGERVDLPEFANQERIIPNNGTGFYGALVGYANGCEMEAVANRFFAEGGITGTEEDAALSVTLFPNPASDVVNIRALNSVFQSGEVSMSVYDALGRLVMTHEVNANQLQGDVRLNVSALSKGSYVIRINGEQSSLVRKFIKE